MVNKATFPTSGNVYSDGSTDEGTGVKFLDNDGHRANLVPMFSEMVAENATAIATISSTLGDAEAQAIAAAASASAASDSADAAAASAIAADASADAAALSETAAANSATAAATALSATSTSSMDIGTGSKSFTMTAGKSFNVGSRIRVAQTSTPANYMEGIITAFNSGSGVTTFTSDLVGGSGSSITDWSITLAGEQGIQGIQGDTGAGVPDPTGNALKLLRANASGTDTEYFTPSYATIDDILAYAIALS